MTSRLAPMKCGVNVSTPVMNPIVSFALQDLKGNPCSTVVVNDEEADQERPPASRAARPATTARRRDIHQRPERDVRHERVH